MKFGIVPVNLGRFCEPETIVPFAQQAEALGFESLWTFEHVIIPKSYDSVYPYNPTGKLSFGPDAEFIDPLIALTYIAASTKKLRLGTGVNILPQVSPLYFAKQTACIDHLSNGRLMLGLGVGWLKEEFDAIGVPFERRGERTDEYLKALKLAWSGKEVNFKGEFLDWHDFKILPPSKQKPHIPVIIGGTTKRAIRRLVEHGDGWYVIHKDLDHLRENMAKLDKELKAQGRKKQTLELTAYWNYYAEGLDSLKVYEDMGIERVLINVHALRQKDIYTALEVFANDVISKVA
ncbi:MAG: LLM class F420-dependent oxidoreductase [Candidatus Lambdaproteobacteria bacterium]|nr:LLM class F420-dependent oxidoreductase [Candidatus Lambdaproteobacteria bacterium]